MAKLELFFHTDPGHGWLEIPGKVVRDWRIQFTTYSYYHRGTDTYYAEEDVDMGTFIQRAEREGFDLDIQPVHHEVDHFPTMFGMEHIGSELLRTVRR